MLGLDQYLYGILARANRTEKLTDVTTVPLLYSQVLGGQGMLLYRDTGGPYTLAVLVSYNQIAELK